MYKVPNSMIEDEQIVREVLAGNKDRYALLVKKYQTVVANLVYKICGTKADVKELTQQVFVELYVSLPRFQYKSKLSTFIYRITINLTCKYLYKQKRSPLVDPHDFAYDRPSGYQNAEQQIVNDERLDALRLAIGKLKHEQRTALVLYTYEDFTYQEIADAMGCSLSKVESLIFRAKKNLQKLLKNER